MSRIQSFISRHHRHIITGLVSAAIAVSGTVAYVKHNPSVVAPPIINTSIECHANGTLPDSACTPGVADPRVTQANIQQTICVSGYTKTVRPPASYTNQLKVEQIKLYGYSDTNIKDYEEDHLISLELGGSPSDAQNLWPEAGASPNAKDQVENRLHKEVCNGQITLIQAQHEIATDWTKVQ